MIVINKLNQEEYYEGDQHIYIIGHPQMACTIPNGLIGIRVSDSTGFKKLERSNIKVLVSKGRYFDIK